MYDLPLASVEVNAVYCVKLSFIIIQARLEGGLYTF